MIDINKMRRLAQAATPGPWVAAGPSFGESLPKYLNEVAVDREGDEDDGYSICNAPIGLNEECSDDMAFIAEANPLTIEELLDRLEAAEKSRDDLLACLGEWLDKTKWVPQGVNEGTISEKYLGLHRADVMARLLDEAEKERDALRAKITEMEKQEPAGYGVRYVEPTNGEEDWDSIWKYRVFAEDHIKDFTQAYADVGEPVGASTVVPLYALPGAQQCKNCNGMGDRFDPSGEKIPCDLCESHLEEIRSLVAEAAHDIISGSDFWLSISLAAKKIYALPGAKGEKK